MALLASFVIGLAVVYSPFASEGDPELEAEVAVTFQDEAISESSGLVVRGDRLHTINDSGDGPKVYAVDRRTGETVAVDEFSDEEPEDLEALAPGPDGTLWVGDIGDNRRARGSIQVHRFVPSDEGGRVRAATYELAYPDGPHDSEALLVHPRTGRVLVVTKRPIVGGAVYRAPKVLREGGVHQLERAGAVSGMITDGTFLPDGRHVLVRTSGGAAVYTYPGFDRVAEFLLPLQEQGEGIAAGDDGRVYLSSEGVFSDVLVMDLPALDVPADAAREDSGPVPDEGNGAGSGRLGYVLGALAGALTGAAVVTVLVRAARRRSRRRP